MATAGIAYKNYLSSLTIPQIFDFLILLLVWQEHSGKLEMKFKSDIRLGDYGKPKNISVKLITSGDWTLDLLARLLSGESLPSLYIKYLYITFNYY